MKTQRFILIVEDEKDAIDSWGRDVREFNRDPKHSVEFEAIYAKSKAAAVNILKRTKINCAVVDLRIPAEEVGTEPASNNANGNDVLEQLLIEVGVPAVVYSGHIPDASERVKNSPIEIIAKTGGGAMASLVWLAKHEPLMAAMESTHRRLARETSKIFTRSIWPRWHPEWKPGAGDSALADVITRQVASYIAETLGSPDLYHHPEEFYQVPSLDDRLGTGDLTEIDGKVYVVVTPRCNIAREYPEHVMLALCKPMTEIWQDLRKRFGAGGEKSAARQLRDLAVQNHATSSHFLPPCGTKGPWLASFENIRTVPATDVPALLQSRIGSIATSFVPNLIQRYAAYLGRIGQPDLDCEALRVIVCK